MTQEEKITIIKNILDNFLKENNIYDAWYERYRLDNLIYNDDLSINQFIEDCIKNGEHGVQCLFYGGMGITVWHTKEGDKFIEKNKKCDILGNAFMVDMDKKWMDTWRSKCDVKKLFD